MKNSKQESIYFENIDALRFLAFFAVFIHHIFSVISFKSTNSNANEFIDRFLKNGQLGVSFFFVLSGFLITYLLLNEKESFNKINVTHFYVRRSLRIWPLYFLILFIGFCLIPYFTDYKGSLHTEKSLYVFFLGNFDLVKNGIGNFFSSVLWSISVEEQFYFIWPILISIIPTKHFIKVLILIILFSIYYRIFGHNSNTFSLKISYHTFSCLYSLAIGGLLACFSTKEKFLTKLKNLSKFSIINIYIIGLLLIFMRGDILKLAAKDSPYLPSILPVFFALFFAFIIAEQVFSINSLFKFGKLSILNKLGKISYGLYCYHMIAIFIVFTILTKLKFHTANPGNTLFAFEAITAFAITIILSLISFHYFEKRFLSYKNKFIPHHPIKSKKIR